MTSPRRIKHPGLSRKMLAYFQEHPNVAITCERASLDTGFPTSAVSNAVQSLKPNHPEMTSVANGVYKWNTNPKPKPVTSAYYEWLGTDREGRTIVRGEDGQLFVLTPL